MRTVSAENKPKTVIKKVVVRPVEIPKVKPVVQQPKEVKPGQKATNGLTVETNQLIQNYFILAQSAYDSKNFVDAENYANRVIEIDPTNCDAWLLKGNCAGWQTYNPQFRLLESINCWNTCIQNSPDNEKEDYLFTVRTNCIEVAIAYAIRQIQGYKTNPCEDAFNVICETVDYLEPMIKKANQTFGVDVVTYEDKLASNINLIIEETSKAAIIKFGKKKEQQTDAAFKAFIEVQDQNIIVWDYLMDIAKRHGTVSALLKDIVKMHETIIRSCGWKLSGNKFKESYRISNGEKIQRLDKINRAKKKLEDKFVDIRKRDRAFQKIKNAEYWENHQEEKQQLLDERASLDHEIFELENSKLKMPILAELRKLEEECIRLNVLKDNPTYTNKERTAFMEQMNKTRKVIVSKKREIASIIDPIDKKIEEMKRRMVTIDAELNMNR
jgi:tetratricopeptide (TPR) repeat protein